VEGGSKKKAAARGREVTAGTTRPGEEGEFMSSLKKKKSFHSRRGRLEDEDGSWEIQKRS